MTFLDMWLDTAFYDLIGEQVVKETISSHDYDVIVPHFVLVVDSIIRKLAVLSALIWEIEGVSLSF